MRGYNRWVHFFLEKALHHRGHRVHRGKTSRWPIQESHPLGGQPNEPKVPFSVSSVVSPTAVFRLIPMLLLSLAVGCGVETHRPLAVEQVATAKQPYNGPKSALMVGKFDNRSSYQTGLFSDGVDRMGGQAKGILVTHLQQSGRFSLVDRENMEETAREAAIRGSKQQLKGAQYAVVGEVAEFGRKEVGDVQLYGILGRGKRQVAYAKVNLKIVDVLTSEIVYSTSGAGEYALSDREIVGFGGRSGYDTTLSGKVLDLAIREAVERLVEGVEQGQWKPAH